MSIVVFTGHMLDKPTRPKPRFPAGAEQRVTRRIEAELETLKATEGYASAACGGDILFHEAMLRRGGKVHVVLPCPIDEFRAASVDISGDPQWGVRFAAVWSRATTKEILSKQCAAGDAMASEYCNRVILGLAAMNAAAKNAEVEVLALWDGQRGDAPGGTDSMVAYCREAGRPVHVIDELQTNSLRQPICLGKIDQTGLSVTRPGATNEQLICALVFADAAGFSGLEERQIPAFVKHYLHGVNRLLDAAAEPPLVRNTWGDGLYVVFAGVRDAGLFALALRDFVARTNWPELDLPEFKIRVGLHAGPVYRVFDPVICQWSYMGAHVTRAARIEPQTPKGEVFASRTFAALAAAEQIREFRCESAGEFELAKDYGKLAMYRVERSDATNFSDQGITT